MTTDFERRMRAVERLRAVPGGVLRGVLSDWSIAVTELIPKVGTATNAELEDLERLLTANEATTREQPDVTQQELTSNAGASEKAGTTEQPDNYNGYGRFVGRL